MSCNSAISCTILALALCQHKICCRGDSERLERQCRHLETQPIALIRLGLTSTLVVYPLWQFNTTFLFEKAAVHTLLQRRGALHKTRCQDDSERLYAAGLESQNPANHTDSDCAEMHPGLLPTLRSGGCLEWVCTVLIQSCHIESIRHSMMVFPAARRAGKYWVLCGL